MPIRERDRLREPSARPAEFEQHRLDYLVLNPNSVVPTLVHRDRPIMESSVIIEYLDDAFPEVPLKPADP